MYKGLHGQGQGDSMSPRSDHPNSIYRFHAILTQTTAGYLGGMGRVCSSWGAKKAGGQLNTEGQQSWGPDLLTSNLAAQLRPWTQGGAGENTGDGSGRRCRAHKWIDMNTGHRPSTENRQPHRERTVFLVSVCLCSVSGAGITGQHV